MTIKSDLFQIPNNTLIQGCIKGDKCSQSQLYKLFAPTMFVVCLRYSACYEEAEEILQEGFLKVFECIQQLRSDGALEGWIKKIMVNCALQKFRSQHHLRAVRNVEITSSIQFCEEDIVSQLSVKELLKMIQSLSPAYRMVFNLYVFEGMKHKEIAKHLGISEGTSKSNLHDARLILQRMVNNSIRIPDLNFVQVL